MNMQEFKDAVSGEFEVSEGDEWKEIPREHSLVGNDFFYWREDRELQISANDQKYLIQFKRFGSGKKKKYDSSRLLYGSSDGDHGIESAVYDVYRRANYYKMDKKLCSAMDEYKSLLKKPVKGKQ